MQASIPEDRSCVKFIADMDSCIEGMNSSPPPPIDLHGLHLLKLVAERRSITAAAKAAGLSQSALTRQIQILEGRLGVRVFERTTRRLELTAAGELLLRETEPLSGILHGALRRIREEFLGERKEIRIGISRSVTLAHLPGLLHAHLRRHPEVRTTVTHLAGSVLVEAVAGCQLDVAVLSPPARLPSAIEVIHRIADAFTIVAPRAMELPVSSKDSDVWKKWVMAQSWIAPPDRTISRAAIDRWWVAQGLAPEVAMEIDSFDMAIHLVALGMGVACVPRRALSAFPRKRQLQRVGLPLALSRELAVIVPKRGTNPPHVRQFIGDILF